MKKIDIDAILSNVKKKEESSDTFFEGEKEMLEHIFKNILNTYHVDSNKKFIIIKKLSPYLLVSKCLRKLGMAEYNAMAEAYFFDFCLSLFNDQEYTIIYPNLSCEYYIGTELKSRIGDEFDWYK